MLAMAGYAIANPSHMLSPQPLAATITPAQTRDVRRVTPWYDTGIASLE
jgi:hypothetical protein